MKKFIKVSKDTRFRADVIIGYGKAKKETEIAVLLGNEEAFKEVLLEYDSKASRDQWFATIEKELLGGYENAKNI